jgi:single-strand DNA-binding protein
MHAFIDWKESSPALSKEESQMAGSVNRVTLLGNLGKAPEVRTTSGGQRVVSFSLATNESWRDKATGERKERAEWHNVVIFNEPLGKIAEQYCKKGSKIYLEGQLRTRKWQDQGGHDRYTTEVVLGAFKGELQLLDSAERRPIDDDERSRDVGGGQSAGPGYGSGAGPIDDDIPF